MAYERVPEDFMKGIHLAPHNFNDPETPDHGEYVHMQLRNDLYYSTLTEVVCHPYRFPTSSSATST